MDLEQMRQEWQAQDEPVDLKVGSDTLLRQAQTRHRGLVRTVFLRDMCEIGAAAAVAAFFLFVGTVVVQGAWFYYVAAASALFVVAFIVIDRVRQRRKAARPAESIADDLAACLAQVEHQIWLLKNVLWWYLLPLGIAIGLIVLQTVWFMPYAGWLPAAVVGLYVLVCVLFFYGVYRLNQYAVRKGLLPRREELEKLLVELRSTNGEGDASSARDDG